MVLSNMHAWRFSRLLRQFPVSGDSLMQKHHMVSRVKDFDAPLEHRFLGDFRLTFFSPHLTPRVMQWQSCRRFLERCACARAPVAPALIGMVDSGGLTPFLLDTQYRSHPVIAEAGSSIQVPGERHRDQAVKPTFVGLQQGHLQQVPGILTRSLDICSPSYSPI